MSGYPAVAAGPWVDASCPPDVGTVCLVECEDGAYRVMEYLRIGRGRTAKNEWVFEGDWDTPVVRWAEIYAVPVVD